jgi:uncharacterized protein (DUF302 family)
MEKNKFYFEKKLSCSFEDAVAKVTEELKKHGFGILTEIDMHEKFKDKLGKDFRKYRILGACNPGFAYKAVQVEDKIGTMLPCSVIVQELDSESTEVAIIDPYTSMKGIGNEQLLELASEVGEMLKETVDNL